MEYIKSCRTNKIIHLEMFNVGLFGDNNSILFGKYLGEILYKTNKTINDFVDSFKANDFGDSAIAEIFKALNNYKTFLLISLIKVERSKKISEDPEYKTKINELKEKFLDE